MSFGFSVPQGGDDWTQVGDQLTRTLNKVTLYEISVVGEPAYKSTSVNLRSCPVQLRCKIKLKRDDDEACDPDSPDYDPDSDDCDEDRDDPDECNCDCPECESESDDCSDCSNMDCEDLNCAECQAQNRSAHMALLVRRMRR